MTDYNLDTRITKTYHVKVLDLYVIVDDEDTLLRVDEDQELVHFPQFVRYYEDEWATEVAEEAIAALYGDGTVVTFWFGIQDNKFYVTDELDEFDRSKGDVPVGKVRTETHEEV